MYNDALHLSRDTAVVIHGRASSPQRLLSVQRNSQVSCALIPLRPTIRMMASLRTHIRLLSSWSSPLVPDFLVLHMAAPLVRASPIPQSACCHHRGISLRLRVCNTMVAVRIVMRRISVHMIAIVVSPVCIAHHSIGLV